MNRILHAPVCLALGILVPACGSTSKGREGESGPATFEVESADYAFVYLRRGPGAEGKSDAQRASIQEAHLAELDRLARQGSLLVAGPFESHDDHPDLRGILILDVSDIEFARGLALADPAVRAGVLVPETLAWRGDAALRRVHAIDIETLRQKEQEDPDAEPIWDLRKYVLVDAAARADADRTLRRLESNGKLLFSGWVAGAEGRRVIFLLDAGDVEEGMQLIGSGAGAFADLRAIAWWGSANLARLPDLR